MTSPPDQPPAPAASPPPAPASLFARLVEQGIFVSRWVLAPIYLGLSVTLLLLLGKFVQKAVALIINIPHEGDDALIIGVLALIDLSLVANLVLMVMFAGYENFVSRFDAITHDRPAWMGHMGLSDLKLKLLTSIVAISAIHLLEDFMHIDEIDNRELGWALGIHLAFVVSGVLLALMDRVAVSRH